MASCAKRAACVRLSDALIFAIDGILEHEDGEGFVRDLIYGNARPEGVPEAASDNDPESNFLVFKALTVFFHGFSAALYGNARPNDALIVELHARVMCLSAARELAASEHEPTELIAASSDFWGQVTKVETVPLRWGGKFVRLDTFLDLLRRTSFESIACNKLQLYIGNTVHFPQRFHLRALGEERPLPG